MPDLYTCQSTTLQSHSINKLQEILPNKSSGNRLWIEIWPSQLEYMLCNDCIWSSQTNFRRIFREFYQLIYRCFSKRPTLAIDNWTRNILHCIGTSAYWIYDNIIKGWEHLLIFKGLKRSILIENTLFNNLTI